MNKIIDYKILFIIAIPLAIILIFEGYKCGVQQLYDDAIFDILCGIFILVVWIKEVINKLKRKNCHFNG